MKRTIATFVVMIGVAGGAVTVGRAQHGSDFFLPGNLLVSRSVYDNNPTNLQVGDILPPGCVPVNCQPANSDGTYPFVWNNDLVDPSFGITSKILLDQLTTGGVLVNSLEVPNSSQRGTPPTKDQVVTSFPSKSELALNLSADGRFVTFMGYVAAIDAVDVSNSNTPDIVDPTNPVPGEAFRGVVQVDQKGKFQFTKSEIYSGNNGRAVILNNSNGANVIYTAGNAGNGGDPQPDAIVIAAGAQILNPEIRAMVAQSPGLPTPVGSFNITQLPGAKYQAGDKVGKDTNFRGMTIFDQVLYYTKGSGGNGINTVYFVDTTGQACPTTTVDGVVTSGGVGIPQASAVTLPTSPIIYDRNQVSTLGVAPYNMCVLKGFPIDLKTKTFFPFGIWFADANTLYVADEGDGDATFDPVSKTFTNATVDSSGKTKAKVLPGLQKWVFDGNHWNREYTLQAGLNLGIPYASPTAGYPVGNNDVRTNQTGKPAPWNPATGGLRNITGRVNGDGTVTIWAITSTVSGNGDEGADPNQLVMITDTLSASTLPAGESFKVVKQAGFGEVLRGVSFTPGTLPSN